MSNAELIAALRRKAKFFSIWRDAEGQNETEILLLQAATALEKSEAEVVRLGGVIAAAWEAGHREPWKRGPDECQCGAWNSDECACGSYGTGPLLSLDANPYRGEQA